MKIAQLFLACSFPTLAAAGQGQVWVVDDDLFSGSHFADLQAAVDAAADGDTVLVRPGQYASATIDGKGIQVVGDWFGPAADRVVAGLVVKNLPAGRDVVIQGLRCAPTLPFGTPGNLIGLELSSCLGDVHVQDVEAVGHAAPGARVSGCANVTFVQCSLTGGKDPLAQPPHGRAGMEALQSAVYVYDSTLHGGPGTPTCSGAPGDGGPGGSIQGGKLFASGSTLRGGNAVLPLEICCTFVIGAAGDGGDGLVIASAPVQYLETTLQGGAPGAPPCDFGSDVGKWIELVSGNPPAQLTGSARTLTANDLVGAGQSVDFHLGGVPGDMVFLYYNLTQSPLLFLAWVGALIPAFPCPVAFAGTLPASGELQVSALFKGLPPGLESTPLFVQGNFITAGPSGHLGTPLSLLLRSCSTAFGEPDCNGNGKADDCDIAAGILLDLNQNWLPDACEGGATWRVDDDAPLDPGPGNPAVSDPLEDGSALHPFDAIAEGVAAAVDFDQVLLADGTYRGIGNRDIDLGQKSIVVASANGASGCIIDPQVQGRAFTAHDQVAGARFEGLTIRNGYAPDGGAIFLDRSHTSLVDCVFENNLASALGGALFLVRFKGTVRGCRFESNTAVKGGGLATQDTLPWPFFEVDPCDLTLEDCYFRKNRALGGSPSEGGGGARLEGRSVIRRTTFVRNHAALQGGALFLEGAGELRSCVVAWNKAYEGGGILASNELLLVGTTVTQNAAFGRAGGVFLTLVGDAQPVALGSSILWGNTAPLGAQLSCDDDDLVGLIDFCDVEGGQAALDVHPSATLGYGPGNVDTDPLFANPTAGDFHLGGGSPLIDAGDPAFAAEPGETDFEGDSRVQGAAVDVGADET